MKHKIAQESWLVKARSPLTVGDAAAAVIVLEDGRYLLQLRDDIEPIWYPGHWGCFGGGVDSGEDPAVTLRRELQEELRFAPTSMQFFVQLDFDLAGMGHGRYFRKYYEVPMTLEEMARLRLNEGQEVKAFHASQMLDELRLSPYDAFALFLHARAFRIGGGRRVGDVIFSV